jgi:thiosulfate/3-mercaptopyruvate sulfurtransferase
MSSIVDFIVDNIIETNELNELIKNDKYKNNLSILDCSWFLPTENKNGRELFNSEKIPYSKFFDIDEIADKSTNLPHMFPTQEILIKNVKELDIRKNDIIVCYDRSGIFSSPRVWFTLKLFGAKNVAVLNGGYPKWIKENLPVVKNPYKVKFIN